MASQMTAEQSDDSGHCQRGSDARGDEKVLVKQSIGLQMGLMGGYK